MGNTSGTSIDSYSLEEQLVNQLKEICDKNGREIDPLKSAPIFHHMGKVYYLRGKQGPDMINLIQSATLYNAAIVRSRNNIHHIEKDLKQLCRYILTKAGAENHNSDLIKQGKQIKIRFKTLRNHVNEELKLISQIPESATGIELENLEKQKVTLVRNLQDYITEFYTKTMTDIANYCVYVLGEPPCKYAIIGMGSLARKEITPYSDFEHIIGLENDVLKKFTQKELEENVISYFRWFSVIFQVVIVNLKETILPSVAIPSLNDYYNVIDGADWFFDDFTTRGISFDFMLPHACHFPLGRQRSTKLKSWKTELIKPVANMLEYLTEESILKEGYHLEDILTKICFVCGNQAVYDEFARGVVEILESKTDDQISDSVKSQISDDLESFATRSTLFQMYMHKEINIKKFSYKSAVMFIAAMGRISNIHEPSCFDIIQTLADMSKVSAYAKHKQMYVVALACEVRLRWYMKCKSQNDTIKATSLNQSAVETFSNIVGKPSTISYFQIAYALQCDISKQLNSKKLHFHSNPQLLNFSIQVCFMETNEASFSEKEIRKTKFERLYSFDECLKLVEDDLHSSKSSNEESNESNVAYLFAKLFNAAYFLHSIDCYDDALEYLLKSLQILTDVLGISFINIDSLWKHIDDRIYEGRKSVKLLVDTLTLIGECLYRTSKSSEALIYLQQAVKIQEKAALDAKTDKLLAVIFQSFGRCFLDMKMFPEAQRYFEMSLQIREQASINANTDNDLGTILHELGRCLLEMNKFEEAFNYYKRSLQIQENVPSNAENDKDLATTLHEYGRCLSGMNQYENAITYFSKSLEIKARISANKKTDRDAANSLTGLGRCLLLMNESREATKFYDKAREILENATLNADTDSELAAALNGLGRCLLDANECSQAFKHLEKALQIKERISVNAATDRDLSNTLHLQSHCFLEMDQPHQALDCLKRALKINEQSSTNPEIDGDLAETLQLLGQCLLEMNQQNEALEYLEKSVLIKERSAMNAETERDLAMTYRDLGRCLFDTNQFKEAHNFFKKALQILERTAEDPQTD